MISAAVTGVHLVLMYKWDARRAIELIEREQVDGLTAVPTVARQLMDEVERTGATLPSLRATLTRWKDEDAAEQAEHAQPVRRLAPPVEIFPAAPACAVPVREPIAA